MNIEHHPTQNKIHPEIKVHDEIYIACEDRPLENEKRRVSVDTYMIEEEMSSDEKPIQITRETEEKSNKATSFYLYCLNHAQKFNGKFLNKLNKKKIYLFLCELGHKFFLTKKEILDGSWCNTCRKTFQNLKRFARENRGELLNSKIEKNICFCCEAGHEWETPVRKAFWHWCRICSKNTKQILKDLIKQENIRIEQKKLRHQVT